MYKNSFYNFVQIHVIHMLSTNKFAFKKNAILHGSYFLEHFLFLRAKLQNTHLLYLPVSFHVTPPPSNEIHGLSYVDHKVRSVGKVPQLRDPWSVFNSSKLFEPPTQDKHGPHGSWLFQVHVYGYWRSITPFSPQ